MKKDYHSESKDNNNAYNKWIQKRRLQNDSHLIYAQNPAYPVTGCVSRDMTANKLHMKWRKMLLSNDMQNIIHATLHLCT